MMTPAGCRWPPTAMAVIGLYRQHLTALRDAIDPVVLPATSLRIRAALSGEAPPFFVLPELTALPHDLAAAEYWDRIHLPGRKPRNWARHYMRRKLADAGIPGHRIDAYMGHGGGWSDPLLPTSMDSVMDQADLRDGIERILKQSLGPLPKLDAMP